MNGISAIHAMLTQYLIQTQGAKPVMPIGLAIGLTLKRRVIAWRSMKTTGALSNRRPTHGL